MLLKNSNKLMLIWKMGKNIWKSLKNFLRMGALAWSLFFSTQNANAIGRLEIWNGCPAPGIGDNYVLFKEGSSVDLYVPYPFPPSMETYYEDSSSNKHSTAGVNITTNKYYNCPLAGQGNIPDGLTNRISFRILSEWPSNTYCSASITTENGYTNFINDVLAYTRANSNSQGYADVYLPLTSNVSNRVYGKIVMRFAPLFSITPTNNSGGTINPSTKVLIPHSDSTNFIISAEQPGNRIESVSTNGTVVYTNSLNDNTMIYTNFYWNNVIQDSNTLSVVFGPKKHNITASAGPNGTIYPTNALVTYGSETNFNITADEGYHISSIIKDGSNIYSNSGLTGLSSTNIVFNNVTNNSSLNADFDINKYLFTVISPHGTTSPTGTTTNNHGTSLECLVLDSPVFLSEGLRAVANGGTVEGNDYTVNNNTNITVNSLTNDAVLTWNWQTQALLTASSINGTTSVSSNWYSLGDNINITNTPNEGYHLTAWLGDTNNCTINGNIISVPIDQPRNITASNTIDTFVIDVVKGPNGTLLPGLPQTVPYNGSKIFHVASDMYYEIDSIKTNSVTIPETTGKATYDVAFNNVKTNQIIEAYFREKILPNGTPYYWLDGIYGLGTNELADSDNDGYLNWQEYILETIPTNPNSKLEFWIENSTNGNPNLYISPTFTDRTYTIHSCEDLTNPNWQTNLATSGNNGTLTYSETNNSPFRVYQVKVKKE